MFAFFIAVILPQQSELATVYGLSESVDTSFFYNASELYRIAESYGALGREFYIVQRWTFDLVWPIGLLQFHLSH
jgi:hypothetical protein